MFATDLDDTVGDPEGSAFFPLCTAAARGVDSNLTLCFLPVDRWLTVVAPVGEGMFNGREIKGDAGLAVPRVEGEGRE